MIPQMDILGYGFNIWLFLKIHVYIAIVESILGIMGGFIEPGGKIEITGLSALIAGVIELVIIICCFIV